ncbi:zinc finger protein 709-like [Stegodyphus dumicola]|uniref:zinc finger protein 709-like n=1 Tax=Stegodyphus dumicola TaxID=202533 RepID=UPI0015A995B5|nr:zinc finger protein 709-like [Stegodyphus dumicola]
MKMSVSPEESSPVTYVTESCCVCDEEFSSDTELSNHLVEHANDEEFQSKLKEAEQNVNKSSTNRVAAEYTKTGFVKEQNARKSAVPRSSSPEVWEIVSDDSDDDAKKSSKVPKLSNSFRLVSTPNKTQTTPAIEPTVTTPVTEPGPPYNCRICKTVFQDLKTFQEHLLTHEKPRPYVCQICNKSFAYKGTLRQHLHMHIGEKSHECKVCHKKFSIKSLLRKHEETHDMQLMNERLNSSQLKV